MLLSIIIPVYKVEEYVEKCLQSVVESGQNSMGKYEVIVVDDGSKEPYKTDYAWCKRIGELTSHKSRQCYARAEGLRV